jgi:hypothetical protein
MMRKIALIALAVLLAGCKTIDVDLVAVANDSESADVWWNAKKLKPKKDQEYRVEVLRKETTTIKPKGKESYNLIEQFVKVIPSEATHETFSKWTFKNLTPNTEYFFKVALYDQVTDLIPRKETKLVSALTPPAPSLPPPPPPSSVTKVPFTDEILAQVEINNYQVNDFQYFVSEKIKLRREYITSNNIVDEKTGQIIIRNQPVRYTVEISKLLPGTLLIPNKKIPGESPPKSPLKWWNETRELRVFFGDDDHNYLTFVKDGTKVGKDGEKYWLFEPNHRIEYGGETYHVTFEGSGRPYLLIDLDEQTLPMKKNERKEPGRKIP